MLFGIITVNYNFLVTHRACGAGLTHVLLFAEGELQMVVTWATYNYTKSVVEYGMQNLSTVAFGHTTTFDDKNDTKRIWYVHRVTLDDLKPGAKYCEYQCQ